MSVKNIMRNLFVSGALALSVGAVCGRPVSASDEFEVYSTIFESLAVCLDASEGKDIDYVVTKCFQPTKDLLLKATSCIVNAIDCAVEAKSNPESGLGKEECERQERECKGEVTLNIWLMLFGWIL